MVPRKLKPNLRCYCCKALKLVLDNEFKTKLKPTESAAREASVQVVQKFLGSHRAQNYAELVYSAENIPPN